MIGPPDLNALKQKEPPRWATFAYNRTPQFKTHSNIGQVKNALGQRKLRTGGRVVSFGDRQKYEQPIEEGYVYEAVEGQWVLRFSIAPGDWPSEHPLWAYKERVQPVSSKAVEEAIASIMGGVHDLGQPGRRGTPS